MSRAARSDLRDPAGNLGAGFAAPAPVMPLGTAQARVLGALERWQARTPEAAAERRALLAREFPDSTEVAGYWHDAAGQPFTSFFTWGHDQDFGFGYARAGAMGARHVEIVSECLALGLLPIDLQGLDLLDIGCWTGGDVLALAGLGARVTAIEEHPVSAAAAARLCCLVGAEAEVVRRSLYDDRRDWVRRFDLIYCSGVIYHVTDPLLFLRICFAYLKPGGRLVLETKALDGAGPVCAYAGTCEKGWNWYSPTRETLGRWLVDAGFPAAEVAIHRRPIGRLLAAAIKGGPAALPEPAGFSRPGSWLEAQV